MYALGWVGERNYMMARYLPKGQTSNRGGDGGETHKKNVSFPKGPKSLVAPRQRDHVGEVGIVHIMVEVVWHVKG